MSGTIARRVGWAILAAWLAIALLADFLASDRPLVLRYQGRTYLLANLVDHDELAGVSGDELRRRLGVDDWAIWAPVRHDPSQVRTDGQLEILAGPSGRHWLGTDDRGRDVLARLLHGTRVALLVSGGAALLALALGVLFGLGALAGPRWLDGAMVSGWDAVAAVPAILLVIAAQGLVGGRGGLAAIALLIALPRAADCARLCRGAMLGALAQPYCEAARALGASRARLLVRHALPAAKSPLAVAAALTAATAVLAEAALGFVGFGPPAPTASWGELLKQAHENGLAWHLALPAGLAITSLAAALNAIAQPREPK